jgi:hypothetical protein
VDELLDDLELVDNRSAKRTRRVVRLLVDWATREGISLDREAIFDPDTVERFCNEGLSSYASRATYRSLLRSRLTTRAPWEPRPVVLRRRPADGSRRSPRRTFPR